MSPFPDWDERSRRLVFPIWIDGLDVSCAVPVPDQKQFCFGSDDGNLVITNEKGNPFFSAFEGSDSGEAINGIAFWDHGIVASTRNEVSVWTFPAENGGRR